MIKRKFPPCRRQGKLPKSISNTQLPSQLGDAPNGYPKALGLEHLSKPAYRSSHRFLGHWIHHLHWLIPWRLATIRTEATYTIQKYKLLLFLCKGQSWNKIYISSYVDCTHRPVPSHQLKCLDCSCPCRTLTTKPHRVALHRQGTGRSCATDVPNSSVLANLSHVEPIRKLPVNHQATKQVWQALEAKETAAARHPGSIRSFSARFVQI